MRWQSAQAAVGPPRARTRGPKSEIQAPHTRVSVQRTPARHAEAARVPRVLDERQCACRVRKLPSAQRGPGFGVPNSARLLTLACLALQVRHPR